jgi:hypothetical protein
MAPIQEERSFNTAPSHPPLNKDTKIQANQTMKTMRCWVALCALFLPSLALFAQYTLLYATNGSVITLTGYTGTPVTVAIPDFVTSIGSGAFLECYSLAAVTIPDSVTGIGDLAFDSCLALTNVAMTNGVTNIGYEAFSLCTNLSNVAIPNSVASIGGYAFDLCSSLTNVTIPNGVASVADGTFDQCLSLASVTIPASVASIGEYAFDSCTNLSSITIPTGVTNIAGEAFYYCTGLTNLTIPNSVTSVGDLAFCSCFGLEAAYFQGNAPTAGSAMFDGESGTVFYLPGAAGWGSTWGGWPTAPLYMPGQYTLAFSTNGSVITLTSCLGMPFSLTLPGFVTRIGSGVFSNSATLASITIPYGVTAIGDNAFYKCTNLTNVTIPSSVTTIGNNTFYSCTNLSAIAIPNSVTAIGNGAFEGTSLTNVTIPNSMTTIGNDTFYSCTNLSAITIPNSVANIGMYAFYNTGLANVTIPGSVTNLNLYAFAACANLRGVYFEGNAPGVNQPFHGDAATAYYLLGTSNWGSTIGGLQTAQLTAISIAATPSFGAAPLTVSFTSSADDGVGNAVSNWNWQFGDGSMGSAQNPVHTYQNSGSFLVVLLETNAQGCPSAGAATTVTAVFGLEFLGLVENGGFETGDFTAWTLSGNDPYLTQYTLVTNGNIITPHSGSYAAALGNSTGVCDLSQTLPTVARASYLLSFWFENPYNDTAQFGVSWNGNTLFQSSNLGAYTTWTNMQFMVEATAASTVLQFAFQDLYDWLGLDDVSVVLLRPNVASISMAGNSLSLNGNYGGLSATYYVLASTNLSLPVTQWTRVATNVLGGGNFSITLTNALNPDVPQQFYILQSQ